MVKQRVDQRSVEIAGRRVDDEPGRLVDDEQMLVLENDLERDVLRFVVRRPWLRARQRGAIFAANLRRGVADRACRPLHCTAADQRFQPLARERRDGGGERAVEAPARMGGPRRTSIV